LHAINAVLFYLLLAALLAQRPTFSDRKNLPGFALGCMAGALFFAIHPLRVESVAWVTERRDVLSGMFYLLALLSYTRPTDRHSAARAKRFALVFTFFGLSLLSKAWAITFPLVLICLDVFVLESDTFRTRPRDAWKSAILGKLPFVALAAVFAVLALLAQKRWAMALAPDHSLIDRLMQAAYGVCFYPVKTLLPVRLSPLYLLPPDFNPFSVTNVACAGAALGLTAGLMAFRRRWPWALCAWLVYLVIISPVLGIAQSGRQLVADRYTYLAGLPFAALIAAGCAVAWTTPAETRKAARLLACTVAVLLTCLGALTFRQTRIWENGSALWQHAIHCDPRNAIAYYNRGLYRQRKGDTPGALTDLSCAISLHPAHAASYNNRGNLFLKARKIDAALADYDNAIRLHTGFAAAYANRAAARREAGQLRAALQDGNTALQLDPGSAQAYATRAAVLKDLGQLDQALRDYDQALGLDADLASAYNGRGVLRHAVGQLEDAMADLSTALRLDPDYAEAYYNRGNLQRDVGDVTEAIEDYTTALRLDPKLAQAHNNRGCLLEVLGKVPQALNDYTIAIQLDPELEDAYNNRANILKQQGKANEALDDYTQAIRLNPRYPEAYCNRGVLRRSLGQLDDAVQDITHCLQVAPPDWPHRERVRKLLVAIRADIATRTTDTPQ